MTLKISYMGGKQAGIIGLLTLLSKKHNILSVASSCSNVLQLSGSLSIPTFLTIKNKEYKNQKNSLSPNFLHLKAIAYKC